MSNVHIMVDLETLGVVPGCKILSIGAVVFGPAGLGAEFYTEIQRAHQLGLKEDPSTLAWWAGQPAIVRDRLLKGGRQGRSKPLLTDALALMAEWVGKVITDNDKPLIWGNGADFDNAILASAHKAARMALPWGAYSSRCYRTLKSLKPGVKLVRVGSHHNALDDAKSQAEHAVRIFREMGEWQLPSAN